MHHRGMKLRLPRGRWRLFFLYVLLGMLFYPTLITSLSTVHRNGAPSESAAEQAERNALAQRPAVVIRHSPPPAPAGTLLISTLDGQLHALDLRSGDYLWSFGAGGAASSGMLSATDSRFGTSGGSAGATSDTSANWRDGEQGEPEQEEEEDADDPESVRRILQRELNADLASHDLLFDQDEEEHSAHPHAHHPHHPRPTAQATASSKGNANSKAASRRAGAGVGSNSSAPLMIPGVDGSLFYSGAHGLQRLPINVAELVDAAPFRTGDNTRYLGFKEVNVFLIDRNSGALRRVFSPRGKSSLFDSCEDELCDPALVWVAKTDLTVHALDGRSGRLRWNVSMAVFGPFDSADRASGASQLSEAELDRMGVPSIGASVDGTVHALDVARQKIQWVQPLHSPVTAVFLVRPAETTSSSTPTTATPPADRSEEDEEEEPNASNGRADMIKLPHFYFNVPEADAPQPPRPHQSGGSPSSSSSASASAAATDPLMSEMLASYYYSRDGAERLQYTYVGQTEQGLIYALPNPAPTPPPSKIAMLIEASSSHGAGGVGPGREPLAIAGGSSSSPPSAHDVALAAAAAAAAGHRPSAGRPTIPAVGQADSSSSTSSSSAHHVAGVAVDDDLDGSDASCVPSSSSYPQCLVGFHALSVSPSSSASAAAQSSVHGSPGKTPPTPQLPAAVDFYNQSLKPPKQEQVAPGRRKEQQQQQQQKKEDEDEDTLLLDDVDDDDDDDEDDDDQYDSSIPSVPLPPPSPSKRPSNKKGGGGGWWNDYPSGFFESLLYFWPLVAFTLITPVVLSLLVIGVWQKCIGEDRRRSWDATRQKWTAKPWGQQKKNAGGGGGGGSNSGGGGGGGGGQNNNNNGSNKQQKKRSNGGNHSPARHLDDNGDDMVMYDNNEGDDNSNGSGNGNNNNGNGSGNTARRRRDKSQRASLQRQSSGGGDKGASSSALYNNNGNGSTNNDGGDHSPSSSSASSHSAVAAAALAVVVPRKTHWSTYETVVSHFSSLGSFLPMGLRRTHSESSSNTSSSSSASNASSANGAGGGAAVAGGSSSSASNSGEKGLRPRKHILSRPDAAKLNSDAAVRSALPATLVRSYSSPCPNPDGSVSIGAMVLFPSRVLGTGSMGTVVYAGTFEGRPCAIKRMVKEFFGSANAAQEIALLIQSDTHPNVLRYYAKDEDSSFIYLALELCVGTIQDLVDGTAAAASALAAGQQQQLLLADNTNPSSSTAAPPRQQQQQLEETIEILHGLMIGLAHLHQLHIVHRDLKPANILLTAKGVVKLADMGLGKQLSLTRSSFDSVVSGSIGWQPPETMCLPPATLVVRAQDAQRVPVGQLKTGDRIVGQDGRSVLVEAAVHLREPAGLFRLEHACCKEAGVEPYEVTPNHRVTLRANTNPRASVSVEDGTMRIRFQRPSDGTLTERVFPLPEHLQSEQASDFAILDDDVADGELGPVSPSAAVRAFAAAQFASLPRDSYLLAGDLFDLEASRLFQLQEALRVGKADALVSGRRVPLPEPLDADHVVPLSREAVPSPASSLSIAVGAGQYEAFHALTHPPACLMYLLPLGISSSVFSSSSTTMVCKSAALVQIEQVHRAMGIKLTPHDGLVLAHFPTETEQDETDDATGALIARIRQALEVDGVHSLVLFGVNAREIFTRALEDAMSPLFAAAAEPIERDGVHGFELLRVAAMPPLLVWFAAVNPCDISNSVAVGRTVAQAHGLSLDSPAAQRLRDLALSESLPLRRVSFVPGAADVVSVTVSGVRDGDRRFALDLGGSGVLTHNSNGGRLTKAVDVFSAGCVMHYVLTKGVHPFGETVERELNISLARMDLSALSGLPEARDLIGCCIHPDPALRLSAEDAVAHPFFWPASKQLQFLLEASDRFESELPHSELRMCLEAQAAAVVGANWAQHLDQQLVDNLGQYRKYNTASVRDCLRVIRNKRNHYRDLPLEVRQALGPLPDGFLRYFTSRFPALLVYVYSVLACFALESPASSPGDPCSYSPLDADTDYTRAALGAEAAAAAAAAATAAGSAAGAGVAAGPAAASHLPLADAAERFEAMAAFYNKPLRMHPQLKFSSLPLQPFFQEISLRRLVQLQKHTRLRFRHWYVREEQWGASAQPAAAAAAASLPSSSASSSSAAAAVVVDADEPWPTSYTPAAVPSASQSSGADVAASASPAAPSAL